MTEQIGITPIAVTKSKHSQKETLKLQLAKVQDACKIINHQ